MDDERLTSTQCIILGGMEMSIKVRVMRTAGVLTGLEAKRKRITKLVGGYKTKCHENAQLLTEIEPDQS